MFLPTRHMSMSLPRSFLLRSSSGITPSCGQHEREGDLIISKVAAYHINAQDYNLISPSRVEIFVSCVVLGSPLVWLHQTKLITDNSLALIFFPFLLEPSNTIWYGPQTLRRHPFSKLGHTTSSFDDMWRWKVCRVSVGHSQEL